ncbi:MAG: hypothetical protein HQK49_10420 [Oligoflexia bacterium]|nr:hypothetical protein [Oligoflexia bacterium]
MKKNSVELKNKVDKSLLRLKSSLSSVSLLSLPTEQSLDKELVEWDAFSSRFSRCVDIFLTKYIRSRVLEGDPAFRGTLRDFLDQAEKMLLISNIDRWMLIRELRNYEAHEYGEEMLQKFLTTLKNEASFVIAEIERIK